jgi:hypothetical protein
LARDELEIALDRSEVGANLAAARPVSASGEALRLGLQANVPEKLDPGDDDRSTPDHRVERLEGLLLTRRKLPQPLHDEFNLGLDRTEIDVLGGVRRGSHRVVVIVSHVGSRQVCGEGVSAKLRRSLASLPRSMAMC